MINGQTDISLVGILEVLLKCILKSKLKFYLKFPTPKKVIRV